MNLVALARKIRSVREGKNLTAQKLAQAAGVSKSLMSRIENFRVTPSLPVLLRIAEALEVSPGDLLENVSSEVPKIIVTRRNRSKQIVRNPERKGLRYFELAGTEQNRTMLPLLLRLSPDAKAYRPMRHEGEEFMLVLKGALRLKGGGEEHVLRAGDSAYFDAQIPHSLSCVGRTDARILSVICGLGKLGRS